MSVYPDDIRSYDNDPRSPFYTGGRNQRTNDAAEQLTNELENFVAWIDQNAVGPLNKGETKFHGWMLEELNSDEVHDTIAWPLQNALSTDDGDTPDDLAVIWDETRPAIEAAITRAVKRLGENYVVAQPLVSEVA